MSDLIASNVQGETEYQVWRHVPSGERYIVEVDKAGLVVAAVGPVYYDHMDEMLRTGDWEGASDALLIAQLNADPGDYELEESRPAPEVE